MNPLASLKTASINSLALHCGLPTATNKAARLAAIIHLGVPLQNILNNYKNKPLRVVSVDVGLKNFSYCKTSYQGNSVHIKGWDAVNLHHKFGVYDPVVARYSEDSLETNIAIDRLLADTIDSKAYLSRLAVATVDQILVSSDHIPHVITVESQRTRSNANKVTLPNIMLNSSFEHMLYAVLAARQSKCQDLSKIVVIPMHSNKMVNFWLARFLDLKKMTMRSSKLLRASLLYSWFENPLHSPFNLSPKPIDFPSDFQKLSANKKLKVLTDSLNLSVNPSKVDDMVDSVLYNMAIAKHLQHYQEFLNCKSNTDAFQMLIDKWDREHCDYLATLTKSTGLQLDPFFSNVVIND